MESDLVAEICIIFILLFFSTSIPQAHVNGYGVIVIVLPSLITKNLVTIKLAL